MNNQSDAPFRIETGKISKPGLRFWLKIFRPLIERILCFPKFNAIYRASKAIQDEVPLFSDAVLKTMDVKLKCNSLAENPIPSEGPVIVVANHPFGGIEGLALISLLEKHRPGSMVMANYILAMIPDLRKHIFFVDPFGGEDSKRANLKAMKSCLKWLEDGNVLGIFPAGEVSSIDPKKGFVRDIEWSTTVARMARRTNATIVPLYFGGDNGFWFNLAGRIHPRLRTILLPKYFVNKFHRTIRVEFGQPITPHEYAPYDTDEKLSTFMRLRTYALGEREGNDEKGKESAEVKQVSAPEQIIDAVSPDIIADEIAALPEESHLCEAEGFSVLYATAAQIPNALREIGRLREITYRSVGEGTNKSIDLDEYDNYYGHLFIWNGEKKEIVGAYRFGLADEIVRERGVEGLYTQTLFDYDDRLIEKLNPAIELGRSFVRQEYQRAYSSLMLLWKGLLIFMAKHPKYRVFFGPVSISDDYAPVSRDMILRSLRLGAFRADIAPLVKPRVAPPEAKRSEWNTGDYDDIISDIEQTSKLVQEIEKDQKGVPVLLRHYIKMGGKILTFNVDPAFNYCVDGFITTEVPAIDSRVLKRYMGADNYAAYMEHHQGFAAAAEEKKDVAV